MAYNTRYHLEWNKETGPEAQEIARVLEENIQESDRGLPTLLKQTGWQEVLRGDLETSWYNHKRDMAHIVSRRWPNVRFDLYGKGDEDDGLGGVLPGPAHAPGPRGDQVPRIRPGETNGTRLSLIEVKNRPGPRSARQPPHQIHNRREEMPYRTRYLLKWNLWKGPTPNEVTLELRKSVQKPESDVIPDLHETAWKRIIRGETEIPWRSHQWDIATTVSQRWPDVRFELYGHGEDKDDIWAEYFLGGKVQRVDGRKTYPEFNQEKLTQPEPPGE